MLDKEILPSNLISQLFSPLKTDGRGQHLVTNTISAEVVNPSKIFDTLFQSSGTQTCNNEAGTSAVNNPLSKDQLSDQDKLATELLKFLNNMQPSTSEAQTFIFKAPTTSNQICSISTQNVVMEISKCSDIFSVTEVASPLPGNSERANRNTYETSSQLGDAMVLPSGNNSSAPDQSNEGIQLRIDGPKKQSCFFCSKIVSKIARHCLVVHSGEKEVQEILSYREDSKPRKLKLDKLRLAGNFRHNIDVLKKGQGTLIIVKDSKDSKKSFKEYIPCGKCLGFFNKRCIYKHYSACKFGKAGSNVNVIQLGYSIIDQHITGKFDLLTHDQTFTKMRRDDIRTAAREDVLISKFCRSLEKRGKRIKDVSFLTRLLSRFLLKLREKYGMDRDLLSFLKPDKFDCLVEAARELSYSDDCNEKSYSFGIRLGSILKKCCTIAKVMAIKKRNDAMISDIEWVETLLSEEWSSEINQPLRRSLNDYRLTKPEDMPRTEDIMKLSKYFTSSNITSIQSLKQIKSWENWRDLASVTLANIILFNKNRDVNISKALLKQFLDRPSWQNIDFMKTKESLSQIEIVLHENFDLMLINGKRDFLVPILLTTKMTESLRLLCDTRNEVGIHQDNTYLFATKRSTYITGGNKLTKAMKIIGVKRTNLHTLHLKKYFATVTQLLNLEEKELDILSNHFGYDFKGFEDSSVEMTKMCKLFLAIDQGKNYKVKGKSLDEINNEIDMEDIIGKGNSTEMENVNNEKTLSVENVQDSSSKQNENVQKKNNEPNIEGLGLKNSAEVNSSNNREELTAENPHDSAMENVIEEPNDENNKQIDMEDIGQENFTETNNSTNLVQFTVENDEDSTRDNIFEQNLNDRNNVINSEVGIEGICKENYTEINNINNNQTKSSFKDSDLASEKVSEQKEKNQKYNEINFIGKEKSGQFSNINSKEHLFVENCEDTSEKEFERNENVQKIQIFSEEKSVDETEINSNKNQDIIEKAHEQNENVQKNDKISIESVMGKNIGEKNYSEISNDNQEVLRVDAQNTSAEQEFQQNSNIENNNEISNEINKDIGEEYFSEIYDLDTGQLYFNVVQESSSKNVFKHNEVQKNNELSTDIEDIRKEHFSEINNSNIQKHMVVQDSANTSNGKVIEQNLRVQKNNEISNEIIMEKFVVKENCTVGTNMLPAGDSQTTSTEKVFEQKNENDQKNNDPIMSNLPTQDAQYAVRRKWDKVIKSAAFEYFRFNLANKAAPRRKECLEFIEKYQIKDRTWKDVKTMIYNQYRTNRELNSLD